MASVSIQAIKELRERTSAGMGDCKKALIEAEGDMDKAVEVILKKGQAKSAKRSGKVAAEGEVRVEITDEGRKATLVEVNIETDFSARNDKFKAFVTRSLEAAKAADADANFAELQSDGKTLTEHASELTAIIGEKITLRRFENLAIADGTHGFCHGYVHMGGKIGVLVQIEAETADAAAHQSVRDFADDTAMQIAAMAPAALRREDIDESLVAKQREIYEAQLREEPKPKPEKIWPKIIDGKIDKWFAEVVLLEQESAQHKKKIDALLKEAGEQAGAPIGLTRFVRFELGEGIEKKQEDLASAVAEVLQ